MEVFCLTFFFNWPVSQSISVTLVSGAGGGTRVGGLGGVAGLGGQGGKSKVLICIM